MPTAPGMIEVTLVNWDELRDRFARAPELMFVAANEALRRVGRILVPALKAETPVGATGHLRNYTVSQVMGMKEDMRLEIRQSAHSESGFFYGVAVRQGTRPHFPPPRALVPWVMRKLGITGEKEALSVAYAIAVKISRVGTKANPYHVRVMEAQQPFLVQTMIQIIDEQVVGKIADVRLAGGINP